MLTRKNDLLAGCFFHGLREVVRKLRQFRQHLDLVHDPGSRPGKEICRIYDVLDAPANLIKISDLERSRDPLRGAECIRKNWKPGIPYALE